MVLDLNFFSTDWLVYNNLLLTEREVKKLSFIKKYLLSVYPDIFSKNYNFNNTSVLFLSNFRKNNFPIINEIVENSFYQQHNLTLKEFNKIGNFLLNSNFNNNFFKNFMSKSWKFSNTNNKQMFLYNLFNFIFFCQNNFYFFLTFKHFFKISKRNFVKFNFLFLYTLKSIKNNTTVNYYYLDNVFNWFSFNSDSFGFDKSVVNSTVTDTNSSYLANFSRKYNNTYKLNFDHLFNNQIFFKNIKKIFLNDVVFNFKFLNNNLFNMNKNLLNSLKINFSESSTNKHIDVTNNFTKRSNYLFFFLRKNKIFNKGRYSRNRQTYRTGFYWCLWVNIFAIYGLHYLCYRFTFAFGYLWLPLIIFFGSFIFSRMLKYNFHNFNYIFSELNALVNWFGFLLNNFLIVLKNFLKSLYMFSNSLVNLFNINKFNNFFLKNFSKNFNNFWAMLELNRNSLEHTHVWHYLNHQDNSFFNYFSKIFFINQFFFKK